MNGAAKKRSIYMPFAKKLWEKRYYAIYNAKDTISNWIKKNDLNIQLCTKQVYIRLVTLF
jgi:hypothetical protein